MNFKNQINYKEEVKVEDLMMIMIFNIVAIPFRRDLIFTFIENQFLFEH
jgi:hypothetical protein